jgi:hypothetical protein
MLEPCNSANHLATGRADGGCRRPDAGADQQPALVHVGGVELSCRDQDDADGRACGWSSDWLQLSHELRTPLNAILGNVELLLDGSAGPLSSAGRACIADIQAASRQLMAQLQPLLLLVQARTCPAPVVKLPLDLFELLWRASADRGPGRPGASSQIVPEGARLMVPGDPVWLGVLAASLVDLHAVARDAAGPMSVALDGDGHGPSGVGLRIFWTGFNPAATSPLPLALVDAVLQLHEGRIRSLTEDGLRLDLPTARVEPSRTPAGRDHR